METSPYGEIDKGELPTDMFDQIYPDMCELDPENPNGHGFSRWEDVHLFERVSNYQTFLERPDLSPGTRERVAKILSGLTFEIDWRIRDLEQDQIKDLEVSGDYL